MADALRSSVAPKGDRHAAGLNLANVYGELRVTATVPLRVSPPGRGCAPVRQGRSACSPCTRTAVALVWVREAAQMWPVSGTLQSSCRCLRSHVACAGVELVGNAQRSPCGLRGDPQGSGSRCGGTALRTVCAPQVGGPQSRQQADLFPVPVHLASDHAVDVHGVRTVTSQCGQSYRLQLGKCVEVSFLTVTITASPTPIRAAVGRSWVA